VTDWQIAGLVYGFVGMCYTYLESTCFEYEFNDATKTQIFLTMTQQANHFLRCALFWPSYMFEDLIIYILNRGSDDGYDGPDDLA